MKGLCCLRCPVKGDPRSRPPVCYNMKRHGMPLSMVSKAAAITLGNHECNILHTGQIHARRIYFLQTLTKKMLTLTKDYYIEV